MSSLCLFSSAPCANAERNDEEWYDPSDWFDGDEVDSDDSFHDNDYTDYDPTPYRYSGHGAYPYDYNWGTRDTWRNNYRSDDSGWSDTYDYSYDRNQKPFQISGTIDGFREVDVRDKSGRSDKFTVVRLRLKNGEPALVDNGQFKSLNSLQLQKGNYVSVRGRRRNINGRDVILANQIYSDGKTSYVTRLDRTGRTDDNTSRSASRGSQSATGQRQSGNQQTASKNQQGQGQQTFQGMVESYRRVNVEGERGGDTLVKIRTEDNRSRIVDLGPSKTPESLGISRNDYVTVIGRTSEPNGKPILNAQSVTVNGSWNRVRQDRSSSNH